MATKEYTDGVLIRADHHARNVIDVFPALVGFVETYADPGSIKHHKVKGNPANVTWATFGGRRIAFRYEHANNGSIEAKDGSLAGPLLMSFDNTTPNSVIAVFFRNL